MWAFLGVLLLFAQDAAASVAGKSPRKLLVQRPITSLTEIKDGESEERSARSAHIMGRWGRGPSQAQIDQWNQGNLSLVNQNFDAYNAQVRKGEKELKNNGVGMVDAYRNAVAITVNAIRKQHAKNSLDHNTLSNEVPGFNSQTDDLNKQNKEKGAALAPDYEDRMANAKQSFTNFASEEEGLWEQALAEHLAGAMGVHTMISGFKKQITVDDLAAADLGSMQGGLEPLIQLWAMSMNGPGGHITRLLNSLQKGEGSNFPGLKKLPIAWMKRMRSMSKLPTELETEIETLETETEMFEELISELEDNMDEKIEGIEEPFEEFFDLVDEMVEEFGEEGGERVVEKMEELEEYKEEVEDSLEGDMEMADEKLEEADTAGVAAYLDYSTISKKNKAYLRAYIQQLAAATDRSEVSFTDLETMNERFDNSLTEIIIKFEQDLQGQTAKAQKASETVVKGSEDKLALAVKTAREKLEQYAKRKYTSIRNKQFANLERYKQKASNYMTRSQANIAASGQTLDAATNSEKELEEKIAQDEKSVFGLATKKKDFLAEETKVQKFATQVNAAAQIEGGRSFKKLQNIAEAQRKKVNTLFDVGKVSLQGGVATIEQGIQQRTSGKVKEVTDFAMDGIAQTNDAKRSMVEIGGRMEDAEEWIRDLLMEIRTLVSRSNSTGVQVVQDAKDGKLEASVMERLLNDTAVNKFGDLEKTSRDNVKNFRDNFMNKLEQSEGMLKKKVEKINEKAEGLQERLGAQKANRLDYEEENQAKVASLSTRVSAFDQSVKALPVTMLGHVDELTGEINRVAADLETKREAIKGSGMQAIDKLTNKARAMATDFLAQVSERVARADGTLSLELRRKLEGLQGLLTRNTEAIGTAEKKAESGMEEGELRLAELGNVVGDAGPAEQLDAARTDVERDGSLITQLLNSMRGELSSVDVEGPFKAFLNSKQDEAEKDTRAVVAEAGRKAADTKQIAQDRADKFIEMLRQEGSKSDQELKEMLYKQMVAEEGIGDAAHELLVKKWAKDAEVLDAIQRLHKGVGHGEDRINQEEQQALTNSIFLSESSHRLDDSIWKAKGIISANAQSMELGANRVLGMLDSSGMVMNDRKKIELLQKSLDHTLASLRKDTDEAQFGVQNAVYDAQATFEKAAQDVRKKQTTLRELDYDIGSKLGPLDGQVADDAAWADSASGDLHDIIGLLEKHDYDREFTLRQMHKQNMDAIARAAQLAEFTDAGALDEVEKALEDAAGSERNVSMTVETEVKPQTSHWRKGIGLIIERLGGELNLDKMEEAVTRNLARGKEEKDVEGEANEQLSEIIRKRRSGNNRKFSNLQRKYNSMIEQALHNSAEVTSERKSLDAKLIDHIDTGYREASTRISDLGYREVDAALQSHEEMARMETTKSKADASLRSWTEAAPKEGEIKARKNEVQNAAMEAQTMLRIHPLALLEEKERTAAVLDSSDAEGMADADVQEFGAVERELEKVERARDSEDSRLATELSALRASDTQPSGTAAALKQPQVGLRASA